MHAQDARRDLPVVALTAAIVSAQTPEPTLRTPDGHPDLQGTYDIATMTPLERPAGTPLVMSKEEAARLERQRAEGVARAALPSSGDREAPPTGGDGSTGPAGNVGGYNNFWIDNGTEYLAIDGQKRMSVIVDPPDGRIPGDDAGGAAAAREPASRGRPPTPRRTTPASRGRPPTTTWSAVRSASGACSDSDRRPGRRCCPCSTTTCTRSCRPRIPC